MENQFVSDPKDVELEETISRAIHGMASHLHVSVRAGKVTVSGSVDDFGDKRDVTNAVRAISGVHGVINNIRVAPTSGSSPF